MRRLFVLGIVIGMMTVSAGAAVADAPGDKGAERWTEYGVEVLDDLCAFPIMETNEAHWMFTPSGVLILQGFYELSNPATGTSYAGNWTESWKVSDKGIHGSGVFWKLTVPGHGLVLIDAGYRLYGGPPDYELMVVHGPSSFEYDGGLDEFCELME
ncbi:MAG: hypothetical protein ABFR95_03340 [Actinomycetota bacterium]